MFWLKKKQTKGSSAQREDPEKDEDVSAQESSQEVGGNNRKLNFLFMALITRSGRIIRTPLTAVLWP